MGAHAYNTSTLEEHAGRWQVQSHLGYLRRHWTLTMKSYRDRRVIDTFWKFKLFSYKVLSFGTILLSNSLNGFQRRISTLLQGQNCNQLDTTVELKLKYVVLFYQKNISNLFLTPKLDYLTNYPSNKSLAEWGAGSKFR
jgi:hypothetical protein